MRKCVVPGVPRRERVRTSTIEEIKATASRLMSETGTLDVKFTDIARAMGMTSPALYRYFADRDALLTALIGDGFQSMAAAMANGRDSSAPHDAWARFRGLAGAVRSWALEDPIRYALIFGTPIPGYAAPEDGETTVSARQAMRELVEIMIDARANGQLKAPPIEVRGAALAAHLEMPDMPVEWHQSMMQTWMGMHGFVSLEAFGHLAMMPAAARDDLYEAQIRLHGLVLGLAEG